MATPSDVVRAEAADVGALAVGILYLADDLQLAGVIVELGLHVGEAVDAADDLGRILAETVEDDAQRLLAGLVGVADDADGALGGGERLVTGEEREALRVLAEETGCEVTVAETYFSLVSN